MLYRLPMLFSCGFYLSILLLKIQQLLNNSHNISHNNILSATIGYELLFQLSTTLLMFILSCFLFFQNKIYLNSFSNKVRAVVFGIIMAGLFYIIEAGLNHFVYYYLANRIMRMTVVNYESSTALMAVFDMIAYLWSMILIGVVFYFCVKMVKSRFQLFTAKGHAGEMIMWNNSQLQDSLTTKDHQQLYGIIFTAIFVCVSNSVLFNLYLAIFLKTSVTGFFLEEQFTNIVFLALFFTVLNVAFLYNVSQKFIIRTYQWLPISSLLTASALVLVLFGLLALITNIIGGMIISWIAIIFISHTIMVIAMAAILLGINYCLLYLCCRWILPRYFR